MMVLGGICISYSCFGIKKQDIFTQILHMTSQKYCHIKVLKAILCAHLRHHFMTFGYE